jgi:CelD/BcsL family acetyltransferase involved in cellulose biosynthesis
MENFIYEAPDFETIEVIVEKGFAVSDFGSGDDPFE